MRMPFPISFLQLACSTKELRMRVVRFTIRSIEESISQEITEEHQVLVLP